MKWQGWKTQKEPNNLRLIRYQWGIEITDNALLFPEGRSHGETDPHARKAS